MPPDTPPPSRAPGEVRAVVLSVLYFFCVLAAYYVIRPVRDQLSASVGSTQLPWFYAATFVATLLLAPLYAWLATHQPRRVLVPIVHGAFVACLLAFVPLFALPGLVDARTLGIAFFIWLSVFSLFVVSLFWSVMADIWDAARARRYFPVIALGGTAGAIAGPAMTRVLVGALGIAPLLLVSAILLVGALACAMALGRWASAQARSGAHAAAGAVVDGNMFDGIRQVLGNPFMRGMALLMVLGDAVGTINYALVTDYSRMAYGDAVSRTRFAAELDLSTNVLQALLQLTVARWLLVHRGATAVVAIWGAATVAVLACVALSRAPDAPLLLGMPAVALALVASRGLAYGMLGPARESLFTQVPRNLRYLGKNTVDTAVWRLGDLGTSTAMNLLRASGVAAWGFAAFAAGAAGLAGFTGWRIARGVERATTVVRHG